jgi:hypothetical protein
MMSSVFTDYRVDPISIFYWIGSISDDHIGMLTCGMYMNMAVAEDSLEDAGDLSIDLLDSIKSTLRDTTRER